ncbi:MAG: lasso peptide biosynthesis B2 protein [Vicinamibacterales bacterium]
MTRNQWRTAASILALALPYATFTLLRHVLSLETLTRLAWQAPQLPRDPAQDDVLARRIERMAQLVGAEAHCLPCSLVLYRELSRRGANPELLIGFSHNDRPLLGHAWVVVNGRALNESPSVLATLTPVCAFGVHGQRLPLPSA